MKYKSEKIRKKHYFPKNYNKQEYIDHIETLFEEMKQDCASKEEAYKENMASSSNKKRPSLEKIYLNLERIRSEYGLTLNDLKHFDEHSFPDESYLNEIRKKQEKYLYKLRKEYQELIKLLEEGNIKVPSCYQLEDFSIKNNYPQKTNCPQTIQLSLFPEKTMQKPLFAAWGLDDLVSSDDITTEKK